LKQTAGSRNLVSLGLASVAALAVAFAGGSGARAQIKPPIQTPMPAPDVTLNPVPLTPSPTPSPSPPPQRGRRASTPGPAKTPEPTPTPTSPAYASLDGTWEVQVQYSDHTTYSYFELRQASETLAGSWKYEGKPYPLDGTYDGRLIRIVVKMTSGNVTLSGYVENASDMVGLVDFGGGKTVAFTAEHRAAPNKNLLKRGVEPTPAGRRRR
jgi:hypothetical protein